MKKNVKSILFIFLAFQLLLFYTTCKKDDVQSKTGTFTDARDNHAYKWVRIGDQVWMAENLAYKPSSGNYWAYNNDQNNIAIYGYLYDWKTACNVCPSGWHLPSDAEWTKLRDYLGGYETAGGKLKLQPDGTIQILGQLTVAVFRACPAAVAPQTALSAVRLWSVTGGVVWWAIHPLLGPATCTPILLSSPTLRSISSTVFLSVASGIRLLDYLIILIGLIIWGFGCLSLEIFWNFRVWFFGLEMVNL